jgi:hypothetical protein
MHVSLFGVIKILRRSKLSLHLLQEGNLQQMVVCGTTLWHVGSFSGRVRHKAVSCKEPSTLQVFDLFISKSSIGAFCSE